MREWFPTVAVEDRGAGVLWGAQLAWAGSWEMEVFRRDDCAGLSGGLADREFGHWGKRLAPGEILKAPTAWLACVRGDIDDLCHRFVAVQERVAIEQAPAVERDLPIAFNEYCQTWGKPTHDKLVALADRLRGSGVRYLVIDAGWYTNTGGWGGHGSWEVDRTAFPQGLAATAAAIRERGLVPGLWFEMETVDQGSQPFGELDHLLKRDGVPITVGSRRFWDLRDPWVRDFLDQRVIGRLRDDGFGYLKVDYNETIGLGCDGVESPGEGLRQHVLAIHDLFRRIRREIPELVIENCASGGHRLEPSMMALASQASFSDAHELVEIPIVAANLHRLIAPRQSQIWAVLHAGDDARRMRYVLASTFLGRLCLSGDLASLASAQWELVREAIAVYRDAAAVIGHGFSRRYGPQLDSWRHPQGWQAVVRHDAGQALVVAHAFADAPRLLRVPLPPGSWRVAQRFANPSTEVCGDALEIAVEGDFSAAVVLLRQA
ncbi:MAG: alpha-galactosidase [Planctomycetes bacterium]|nr:alpha-galactosidase [Planctomycetota bacterium]